MKKYFVLPVVLFAMACNSNSDKKAAENVEPGKDTSGRIIVIPDPATIPDNLSKDDTTSGKGILSGKFEIIDYKKDNVKINLPKTYVKFTKSGEYIKNDGSSFLYKIDGDNFTVMASKKVIISKSKIEFLNPEKTSFTLKNSKENSEFTYQKVN